MRKDLIASYSININANTTEVWEALTNPEIIKEYLFGTQTITDWKIGSEIIFKGEYQGHTYSDHGQILENVPNKKLSYSYWSGFSGLQDIPENYATVTYTLEQINETTTQLTWAQKGFPDEDRHKHSSDGLPEFLGQVKSIIEK